MKEIETTAKTTDEAVELALRELDADRADVEIDVVSRGKAGLFGIGGEPARVRVTRLEAPNEVVSATTDVLTNLLSKMGVSAMANLRQVHSEELDGPVFEVEGEDSGLLIGRRGETLRALQFIVKYIASKRVETRVNVMVDVEGYQERRYKSLTGLAERVAQNVVRSERSITLEPMPANERRVVHMALSEHRQVATESMGTGDSRQVVIYLKEQEQLENLP